MSKTITKRMLQQELEDAISSNETMKAAAKMVGFDVDASIDAILESADRRVRVGIYQRGRINTLKGLIEELDDQPL